MYRVGAATILFKEGWTEITLNSGAFLSVPWTASAADKKLARDLGYSSPELMNKDHDPLHVLVAHTLGLGDSGPLSYATGQPIHPMWYLEESIVLEYQRWLAVSSTPIETILEPYRQKEQSDGK